MSVSERSHFLIKLTYFASLYFYIDKNLFRSIYVPLQHTSLQERYITVAVHCNVAVWLQVALQYYCNIVETLPWNIAMYLFVHCSWNIVHTLPCNIAMATFVQRFGNIAYTLPCNIAMAPFVQYFGNIAHTLPCNIAMAPFVQYFGNIAHTLPCNIAYILRYNPRGTFLQR